MLRFLWKLDSSLLTPFRAMLLAIVVQTIGAGAAPAVGLVYVDADDGIFTGSPNLSPLGAINSNASLLDNLWGYRGFGSDFSIFESSINANPGAEDSPELTLTIDAGDGLISGNNYDVYVAFWSSGADWNIRAGLSSGNLTLFNRDGPDLAFLPDAVAGTPAASVIWSTPPSSCTDVGGGMVFHPVCSVQDDRTMYLGQVGTATATGGQIQVFIDDLPTTAYEPDITPANAVNFRTWLDGVAFIEAGTPLTLEAAINRDNGQLTIANNTGAAVSFTSLSITSAAQALDASNWTSITGNYDQGGGLDTDAWEITDPTEMPLPSFTGALSEMESAGGAGGAMLGTGGPPVSFGSVWNDTRFEDVQIQVTLASGDVLSLTPTYTGDAHLLGDLSNNGSLGLEDYLIFSANLHTDVSALGQAEAYLRGDMDGDLLINYADFVAFRTAYDAVNGAGSFAQATGVPEPSALALVVVAVILMSSLWGVRRSILRPATQACSVSPSCHSTSSAIQETPFRTSNMIRTRIFQLAAAVVAIAILPAVEAPAINVTLNATDAFGTSSFNAAGNWSNAAAPSAANDYFTGNSGLRTPADGNSYTFAGNSLTVNNTNFDPGMPTQPNGGLWWKGTGGAATITINNLILDGGYIVALNGVGDIFNLAGNLNVAADSYLHARQGPMNVSAVVSGSGSITNPGSDGVDRTLRFMSPANTYSGSIINNGRFELIDDAVMNFTIGASGVNNSVSGTGPETIFNGDFDFDLSGAGTTLGDNWTIASAANTTYGDTFNVPGFFEYATGTWVNGIYQFDEATGVLSVAPAPELLTLKVNTGSGLASITNDTASTSVDMNYYEIRSPSESLDLGGWTSIDGDIPATTTTWEKAGGSSASLISETNLLGMETLAPTDSVSLGSAYSGTLPEHQDLEFFYGTIAGGGTLFRGFVEYITTTGLLGDYNGNGVVDAADYTVYRDTLGNNVPMGTGADGNSNGVIDPGDYTVWVNNFGMTNGGGAAGLASAVPEPTTAVLMILSVAALLVGSRRCSYSLV